MSEAVLRRFVAELIQEAHTRRLPVGAVVALLQTLADLPAPGSVIVGDLVLDVLYPADGALITAAAERRDLATRLSSQRGREVIEEAEELERRARDRGDEVTVDDATPAHPATTAEE